MGDMDIDARFETRLGSLEERLERRLRGIESRIDALRSDLLRVALDVHAQDQDSTPPRRDEAIAATRGSGTAVSEALESERRRPDR
jgi:hypothetical protein